MSCSLCSVKICPLCAFDKYDGKYGPGFINSSYIILYDQIAGVHLKNLKMWTKKNIDEEIIIMERDKFVKTFVDSPEPPSKKIKLN